MRWSERNIKEKKKELVKLKISGWTKYRNKSRCRHVRTSKINPVHVHCFLKQSINLAQNAHSTTYLNDSVLFSLFSFLYAFLKIFWKKKKLEMGRECGNAEKDVLADLIKKAGGCAVVDGGFATQLERHGATINDPLWSALCLIKDPDLIKRVWSPTQLCRCP